MPRSFRPAFTAGVLVILTGAFSVFLPARSEAQATETPSSARRARITGVVTDAASGQPLANANVQIVGTAVVATTGADGRYAIASAPIGIFHVEAKRLGFGRVVTENVRLRADSVSTLDFALPTNPLRLTEMVVSASVDPTSGLKTPYTVDKLTSEDVPVMPVSSPEAALVGKIAGATVIRTSGAPGSGAVVQLRSPVSQFRSNSPLYVVDGVFLNASQASTTLDIESLDIASYEVIKGAAAASLYGSRAASGVISITTNRGRSLSLGTTELTVRNEYGFDQVARTIRKPTGHPYLINAQGQYVNAAGAIVTRQNRVVQPSGIMENNYIDPLYDHAAQFFVPGSFNNQTLTLRQNSASTNFSLSYTRNHQPGVIENSQGFLRQSFRLNVDHRLREALQIGVSASHMRGLDDPTVVQFPDLLRLNPDVNLLIADTLGRSRYVPLPDPTEPRTNPLYRQTFNDNQTNRLRTLLNLNATYRPRNWVSFDGLLGYDRGDRQVTNYVARGQTNLNGEGTAIGSLTILDDDVEGMNAQGGISFLNGLGPLTTRLALRGEMQRETNPSVQTTGSDFSISGVKNMDVARTKSVTSSLVETRSNAGFATLALDYRGKYVGDFLVRREGSSLFGADRRWNTFYRASAAWLLNEESWFPLEQFNLFKLRYNIGTAGTRPAFSDQYTAIDLDGTGGIVQQGLGNPLLRPELSTERELGLDILYRNRIQAQFAYVSVKTVDNIIALPVSGLTGFRTYQSNTGVVTGNTLEATLQARILTNPRGLQWDVLVVADRSRNFISQFNRSCYADQHFYRCGGTRLGSFWGNRLVRTKEALPGVHAASGSAFDINDEGFVVPVGAGNSWRDGKAKNLWGTTVTVDGVSYPWGRPLWEMDETTGQRWYGQIGDGAPAMKFGFGNTFRWRGFRVYGLLNGQLGGSIYNKIAQSLYATNDHPDVDQRNKPDEQRKPTQYYSATLADNNANYSDIFIENGSYARLSELSVGYGFDATKVSALRVLGARRIQLDLIGRNLLTFTGYSGLNPESIGGTPLGRIDNIVYPMLRTWTVAASITF
ncbi:MAG TPA: SusC/RagA family TonB-linked outer membrane protein [Gemmatimonas sp.]|uniref:SusC/RagA family TonB-linked outer membrane protein n=1 Tax=Gemmatimonas sp. TaxID=1962908 RepID=UPI002EDA9A3D